MQAVTTTRCSVHGQSELTLSFDPEKVLERDVLWFADQLEEMVSSGSRFQIGQSLQIGWMLVWFTASSNGTLGFEEPDMKSATPLVRQAGLTNALGHLRFQKDTLESVLPATALTFPTIQQTCLVCTQLRSTEAFFLDRREPTEKNSGWVFACESSHDHQTAASWQTAWLYSTVVERCRRALPYLAFPPGSVITVDTHDVPDFYLNDKRLLIRKDSYLHLLQERRKALGHGPTPSGLTS